MAPGPGARRAGAGRPRRALVARLGSALCLLAAGRASLRAAAAFVPAPSTGPAGAPPRPHPLGAAARLAAPASLLAVAGGADGAHAAAAATQAAVAVDAAAAGAINPTDAIVQAFLLTFVSEIGDKTFFIAAILAAGGSQDDSGGRKVLVFIGAIAALAFMTFLAVAIGQVFHAVPELAGGLPIDDIASVLAFGFFGVKLLLDASSMEDESSMLDEREEAEEAVKESLPGWMSGGAISAVFPPLVLQAFVLVVAAEVGDRSFISAAALSAQGGNDGAIAVFTGGIAAHAIATGFAVLVGGVISQYVTEKQLSYIGGTLFLVFAATSAKNLFDGL